jgi:hypothetical protein
MGLLHLLFYLGQFYLGQLAGGALPPVLSRLPPEQITAAAAFYGNNI